VRRRRRLTRRTSPRGRSCDLETNKARLTPVCQMARARNCIPRLASAHEQVTTWGQGRPRTSPPHHSPFLTGRDRRSFRETRRAANAALTLRIIAISRSTAVAALGSPLRTRPEPRHPGACPVALISAWSRTQRGRCGRAAARRERQRQTDQVNSTGAPRPPALHESGGTPPASSPRPWRPSPARSADGPPANRRSR
jgi:hypothetical protein